LIGAGDVVVPAPSKRKIFGRPLERSSQPRVVRLRSIVAEGTEGAMGFGKGALLWMLGIPLPIIILLALFWHH
jgi:hypothetical protein